MFVAEWPTQGAAALYLLLLLDFGAQSLACVLIHFNGPESENHGKRL